MNRRTLLKAAAAAGGAMAVPAARAQPAPSSAAKGPPVWLDLDQKALDDAYDQSVWATNGKQLLERYAVLSDDARTRLGPPQRFSYGATPVEALDVYRARNGAPIQIFIHGGAWRSGTAKEWAFPADMFVHRGAHFVVPDFASVIDAGGNLVAMAEQVRSAIAWTYRNAARFGGDRERMFVSGHSSGAHLAGVALTTDWKRLGLPSDLVKGGVLLSGMYDLKAVRLSARSRYVHFDDATEAALSPQRHLDRLHAQLVVAHASLDSPEFQRQSRDFAAAVKAAGKPVELLVARGYNHFEAPETLGNPYGLLGRATLAQMALGDASPDRSR
ncbi:MAG: alpha/beta hydrolase [Deltaproteobacteria bacterium]|nr:MAG: alpha/beta hydrolase [Deltaproteobacteria bacterium]